MADFRSTTCVLAIQNLAVSRAFYLDKLGFEVSWEEGGWCSVSRGTFSVRLGECPDAKPISECQDHSWFAYVTVTGIDDLYREYVGRGVEIWHPLETKSWGMREFSIVTVDQHRIGFGEDVAASKS